MNKFEVFLKAIATGRVAERAWVLSAFSLIHEGMDDWKKAPYYLRLVQTPAGNFYVDEDLKTLVLIEDAPAGEPVLKFKDPMVLPAGTLANAKLELNTTVGNVFVNSTTLAYAFGDKLPYIEGKVNIDKIEEYIVKRLTDTPAQGAVRQADKIYVDEYIRFTDAVQHLTVYSQLCVWAATEKTMTAAPGIIEYRNKLLAEREGKLHDPEVIAEVDALLVKYDSEYLKGDPGENFLLSKKSRNVVRKKLFMMHGAEQGIEGRVGVELIRNSLVEGWDINDFPLMNDSLRSGSFNRGAETQLGGEATKWLFRASSNAIVTEDDCGSRVGKKLEVTEQNVGKLVGFSLVAVQGSRPVETDEEAGKYLGKTVMVRSPMYCKLDKTDFCKVCVGAKLAKNPTALSLAVAAYGSTFLSLFMKKMHSSSLQVAKMDYKTALT